MRITVNGLRSEVSLKRYVDPSKWNVSANKMKGTTEEVKTLNEYLNYMRSVVFEHQKTLIQNSIEVTAQSIKDALMGVDKQDRKLLTTFQAHNDDCRSLIGNGFAQGTIERYETVYRLLSIFLKSKRGLNDISLKKIDYAFIMDFDFYLRADRKIGNNTTVKYIKNFKKIIRIALANDWIDKDPFVKYKGKVKEVQREFLIEQEINAIREKEFGIERLDHVRDIFIFCCYTGLAYVDVERLTMNDIVKGIDGTDWIKMNRQKTDVRSSIPLLDIPTEIIYKYADHPSRMVHNKVLPVLSNQKMNSYLKEIQDLCGIQKNLTMHLARHTFATTVTLTHGVSLETVSRMLGHTNVKTTQHYAKILDKKVSEEMLQLKNFQSINNKTSPIETKQA